MDTKGCEKLAVRCAEICEKSLRNRSCRLRQTADRTADTLRNEAYSQGYGAVFILLYHRRNKGVFYSAEAALPVHAEGVSARALGQFVEDWLYEVGIQTAAAILSDIQAA